MSEIIVEAIKPTKSALKKFVKFGIELYKDSPYFVPPLISDDVETLMPDKNPAFDYCRAQAFMAYRDCRPVGRIVAIINDLVNSRSGKREARFGFVDFIDDNEVVDALFSEVESWAREQGMDEMVGPMGFTDMDHEGMLVEGFNEMGTMATIYNFPYYPVQLERLGYAKDVDWVEYRVTVPKEVPEKFQRIADIVSKKYGLRTIKFTSRRKIKEQYGQALFDLINEAYDSLYGYSPLNQRQIDYYIKKYLDIVRLDCLSVVVDSDDRLVALGLSMPSLSQALRKSGGKLWPTGWYHLLHGIHGRNDVVDLLLIAVKKEYMSRGVNAIIFADLIPIFNKEGYREAESNVELEGNDSVRAQWQYFPHRQHRRRRAYRKSI
ncbi:MAG: N-acetyltransferase [Bacteroides sp.]|nr:N-acetyltransferase [Bacteroides sp.]MCM1413800.1 N-acetyltransferase [Bacteroides sp.]MCM1472181.1 N-acetyltransferase [Bacteroides sp.]